ncbi:MAG: response regulator [Hahellaceae bacterium]|nr:response regulator [Hahellaceae bacterium]
MGSRAEGSSSAIAASSYPLRIVGCVIVLLLHVTILGDSVGPWVWGLLLLHTLAYPHIAYRLTHNFQRDCFFTLVDSFAYGCCVCLWGLNPFATAALCCGIFMTAMAEGGLRLLAKSIANALVGILLTGLLNGFYFRQDLSLLASSVVGVGLLGYTLGLGYTLNLANHSLARSRIKIKRQHANLRDISALAEAVNSHLDLDAIMSRVIESLQRLFPLEQLYVVKMEDDGRNVRVIRSYGDVLTPKQREEVEGFTISVGDNPNSIFVHAALQLQPTYIRRLVRPPLGRNADIDRALYDINPPTSVAFFPLVVDRKPIGCIGLLNYTQELLLTEEDIDLIQDYLVQVGTAVRNTQLLEQAADARNEAVSAQQQAEESEAAKGRFLANMSHEIRTPMAAILGYAEALLDDGASEEDRKRYVRTIVRSGNHLLAIINDILDLSKIQAGKLVAEQIEVHLPTLLEEIRSPLGMRAREQGLTFTIETVFPLTSHFISDPTRLRQILLNLGANALKFTREGGVVLRVSQLTNDEAGARLLFEVIDSGIGMDEQTREQLFSPFQQADSSTTRHFGGTGLGLYISRQLAQLLEGDITVESALGEGSNFKLSLPLLSAPHARLLQDSAEMNVTLGDESELGQVSWPRLAGYVLLAEDNPENQELISYMLKQMRVRHRIVSNGAEALRAIKEERFDLLLLDIQMPGQGGEDVMRVILGWHDAPPAIAITANVMRHQVSQYLRLGFSSCIAKPINRQRFAETLASHLRHVDTIQPPRVLIVEDNPVNAQLLQKQIQRVRPDVVVELAENGRVGVQAASQRLYSLILMDLEMPEMTGLEALAHLRQKGYAFPICILSGHGDPEDLRRSLQAGADAHLVKPLPTEALEQALNYYLPV